MRRPSTDGPVEVRRHFDSLPPGRRPSAGQQPLARQRPLIIERPELQTRAQRYGYLSVTFICWFLWLYLFVPLLSLVAWALGATLVYHVMIAGLNAGELLELLRIYGIGIAGLTTLYLLWAVSSYLRFRHADRRSRPDDADPLELAASHHLSMTELQSLRDVRRAVLPAELLERMFGDAAPVREEGDAEADTMSRRAAG